MSSVVIAGDTSGSITLNAPAVAGTTTLTLPTTSGTVALTASPTFTGQATIPTINLTGGQITFPAAKSPSSNANTLDDYEEGTWTPSVGGTATYVARSGQYTKIGNQVTLWFDMNINVIGTGSNNQISGIPFTAVTGTNGLGGTPTYWASLSTTATYISLRIDNGVSYIQIGGSTGATATLNASFACMQNSSRIIGTLSYTA